MLNSINLRREPSRVLGKRSFPLSSGEQSFLRFAALASLHIENGSLVLFDESETHLHPEFISQLVAVLDSAQFRGTGSATSTRSRRADHTVRSVSGPGADSASSPV